MLASFIVYLRPLEVVPLGHTLGRSLHGLLLRLVSHVDPALANALHSDISPKPFTVSPLRGRLTPVDGRPCALPTERYSVRYTVLTDETFNALGHVLLARLGSEDAVTLDGQPFALEAISLDPRQSGGWAGITTEQALWAEARPADRVTLRFASPTTFRTGDMNLLFPLPVSVFGSLARKWQAFCATPLPPHLEEFLAGQVAAERYRLETQVVSYGGHQFNGFVGDCQFRVLHSDPAYRKAVNVLAAFALFAGVGQKTTQGLGQARRLAVWDQRPDRRGPARPRAEGADGGGQT
ncbi:MAG: CRISPR-associated endoribonuclease Cas6 [Anaerolineae bacterium]|nr:CRISPR-associated endoribonuclease Cas6 [Anaerolineae bacterium]